MISLLRSPLAGVVVGTLCVSGAYVLAFLSASTPPAAIWLMIIGTGLLMVAMLALGAHRPGINGRRIAATSVFLLVLLIGGFAAAKLLPAEAAGDPLLFGMPRRAAIVLLGIGVLPVFVLPFIYARDFVDRGLDDAALDRLRREAKRLQQEHGITTGERS